MTQTREEWLTGLRTGDTAYEVSGSRGARVVTVKVTPKQIRCMNAICSIYPKDGISTYGQFRLIPHSENSLAEYRAEQDKKSRVGDIISRLRGCTDSQLERVAAILAEGEGQTNGE